MKYSIFLSDYSGNSLELPILPSELPEVKYESGTEDFSSADGTHYTIIGSRQQPGMGISHMIPGKGKELSFALSDTTGPEVIKMLKEATKNKMPVRYTIAKESGGYYIDRYFAVSSFSYHIDKKNDYQIQFDLTGWKKYKGWKAAAGKGGKNSKNKKVSISPANATINIGKTKTVVLKNTAKSGKVSWKSANNAVAIVNSKGVVTGKSKGKTTIIATYKGKSYECEVGVK